MADGYLEAGFPKPGSLERAVREELPPVTCRPIHASWLCECGPRIKLARRKPEQNQPLSGGPPIVSPVICMFCQDNDDGAIRVRVRE
jgi:hypothetical protein